MENRNLDLGLRIAADLAHIHDLFWKADEVYRRYRAVLLNEECDWDRPAEWIPISDH